MILPTDPPSLPPAPPAPAIFDPRPERNRGMLGVRSELPYPNDNLLIATAVELGCPREFAEQVRVYPPARFGMLQLWCSVRAAARGDPAALEAVDRCRQAFRSARENMVGEALAAREQPADPAELRSLMGLD